MDQVTDDYENHDCYEKKNNKMLSSCQKKPTTISWKMYVMGNKANYDWLMESKAQLGGHCATHELIEVDDE